MVKDLMFDLKFEFEFFSMEVLNAVKYCKKQIKTNGKGAFRTFEIWRSQQIVDMTALRLGM